MLQLRNFSAVTTVLRSASEKRILATTGKFSAIRIVKSSLSLRQVFVKSSSKLRQSFVKTSSKLRQNFIKSFFNIN